MSPERWQQIQNLFERAQACPSGERAAFLKKPCEGDDDLRSEVEWMLTHETEAGRFIQKPALEVAAVSIAAEGGASLAETFDGNLSLSLCRAAQLQVSLINLQGFFDRGDEDRVIAQAFYLLDVAM